MATSAATSTQSRRMLLRHSIMFTIKHPLFGVGPGMFSVADDAYAKANGARKGYVAGYPQQLYRRCPAKSAFRR